MAIRSAGSAVRSDEIEQLRSLAARVAPVTLAGERTLPTLHGLRPLLPGGALVRGATVAVDGRGHGATTLALALAAGPSGSGSWAAAVGLPTLGLAAAAEAGVVLERLAVITAPPAEAWATVVAALVGSVDVVLTADPLRAGASPTAWRRLEARRRERGTVHVVVGAGAVVAGAADVVLRVGRARWSGVGAGHGTLRARRVEVEVAGRRGAQRSRRTELWLPGPDGAIGPVEQVDGVDAGDAGTSAPDRHLRAVREHAEDAEDAEDVA